jgi:hypothetical protein
VFESPILFDIPFKPILVQPIKVVISPNTFQQHLPKTFWNRRNGDWQDSCLNYSSKPSHYGMDCHWRRIIDQDQFGFWRKLTTS